MAENVIEELKVSLRLFECLCDWSGFYDSPSYSPILLQNIFNEDS